MKRMLFALAVAGMAAAGSAQADWGGYSPPPASSAPPAPGAGEFNSPNTLSGLGHHMVHKTPDRYGLLPGLRRIFHLDRGCKTCEGMGAVRSHGSGGGAGYDAYGPQAPPVMQGTLVFPNHPFVRSPRDYFMYEPGR